MVVAVARVTLQVATAVQAAPECHVHRAVQVPVAAEAVAQAIVQVAEEAVVVQTAVPAVTAVVAAEAPEHADDFLAQLLKHKIQTIIRHNYETIAIFSSTASSWYQCPEYV